MNKKIKPDDWQKIAECAWPTEFDPKQLEDFASLQRDRLNLYSKKLAKWDRGTSGIFNAGTLEGVFGKFHDHHSFCAPLLDWRIRLTEPVVTRTIANLLDAGSGKIRALRIQAFLTALRTPDIPKLDVLEGCLIQAEKDRIDLEIWIPDGDSQRYRPVIVEAKFNHHLTNGQLKKYTDKRSEKKTGSSFSFNMGKAHCVVLGLTQSAKSGVTGRQSKRWRFVAWHDLWLRFEKLRPPENDPNLNIFLHMLWRQIGALNPENYNARF